MPDELYRTEWRGNLAGQYRENVMYWKITGATNDTPYTNAVSLLALLHTTIRPTFVATLPTDYILDAILAARVGPTNGNYAMVDYEPGTQPGTRSGGSVSQQLCPCITLIPPMGVKSAGKIFLPAVAKTDIQMNSYAAGYITVVNNFIAACVAGGSAAGGTANIVIYSRKLNTSSVVAGHHLSTVLGYQRRRSHPIGS